MSILLEAYSGTTSNIKKAEQALDHLVKEINKGYDYHDGDYLRNEADIINKSKHLREVEKWLCKEFNFKSLSIQFPVVDIIHFNSGPHTIPSTFTLLGTKNNDFSNASVYIFMDIGYVVTRQFTTKELMAIILHEIGHNIDLSTPTKIRELFCLISSLGIVPLALELIRVGKSSLNGTVDSIITNSHIRKMIIEIQSTLRMINELMRITTVGKVPLYLYIGLIRTMNGVHLGYYGERKSDSVAVKYGYGPELVTALRKFEGDISVSDVEKMINSNPISALAYDFVDASLTITGLLLTPHPSNISRAKNALYKLKSDVKDPSIPKDLKSEIDKEIKELEDIVKQMESPTFRKGEYRIFTALVNKIVGGGNGRNRNILDLLHGAEKYES